MSSAGRSAGSPITQPGEPAPLDDNSRDGDIEDSRTEASVGLSASPSYRPIVHSNVDVSQHRLRRRMTRAGTVHIVDPVLDHLGDRPGWRPGLEPGIDTSKPDGGHASMVNLRATCQITIVDFSETQIAVHELDNDGMIAFLELPQPAWVKCRWINVNALSWDVIQALGQYKQLHSLAIEDLMNTQNRTKADWYIETRANANNMPQANVIVFAGTPTMPFWFSPCKSWCVSSTQRTK